MKVKRIKKLFFWVGSLLLIGGCTSSYIDRSVSDYLKLDNGRKWVYLENGEDTLVRTVVGDTVILGDSAKVVNFGGDIIIYRLRDQRVDIYSHYVTYRGGDEVELENRYSLFLQIPFVLGNHWEDRYVNTVEFLGDTFSIEHKLFGDVLSIESLTLPAGSYNNVYKVRSREIRYLSGPFGEEVDTVTQFLYFAPDVGLVKKVIEGNGFERVLELVSYH